MVTCEPLITADAAAKILRLHPKTVKRLARTGVIPGMRIGRVWRFRASALDDWMNIQLEYPGRPCPEGNGGKL